MECIRTFFKRRFRYESALYPRFRKTVEESGKEGFKLDVMVEASGFGRKEMKSLEEVMKFLHIQYILLKLWCQYTETVNAESEEVSEDSECEESSGPEEAGNDGTDKANSEVDLVPKSEPLLSGKPQPIGDDPNGLEVKDLTISDDEPPQKQSDSPQEDETVDEQDRRARVKDIVSNDVAKKRTEQQRKYHSKRSARNAGRPQGSKAKQDKRVKLSEHTGWT